jgi:hypothetical protein
MPKLHAAARAREAGQRKKLRQKKYALEKRTENLIRVEEVL